MIHIADYGIGNLMSVKNMLRRAGYEAVITSEKDQLAMASKIILPGVGAFGHAMRELKRYDLIDVLTEKAIVERIPILGICLGAQLLFDRSEESEERGLGWLAGKVRKFDSDRMNADYRIPNMGWCETEIVKASSLVKDMPADARFYFAHSYHFECSDSENELMRSNYGYIFTSAVEQDNIVGVQFHPEKSHKFGMTLLGNFAKD